MDPSEQASYAAPTGQESVHAWQQSHHMGGAGFQGESGFCSASITNPPSMSGHGDELDADGNYIGGGGRAASITSSSIYDMETFPHSGKQPMAILCTSSCTT